MKLDIHLEYIFFMKPTVALLDMSVDQIAVS